MGEHELASLERDALESARKHLEAGGVVTWAGVRFELRDEPFLHIEASIASDRVDQLREAEVRTLLEGARERLHEVADASPWFAELAARPSIALYDRERRWVYALLTEYGVKWV